MFQESKMQCFARSLDTTMGLHIISCRKSTLLRMDGFNKKSGEFDNACCHRKTCLFLFAGSSPQNGGNQRQNLEKTMYHNQNILKRQLQVQYIHKI